MAVVLLFGLGGLRVAATNPQYRDYLALPILLVVLSGTGMVSVLIRLIRRRFGPGAD